MSTPPYPATAALLVIRTYVSGLYDHLEHQRNARWAADLDATPEHVAVLTAANALDLIDSVIHHGNQQDLHQGPRSGGGLSHLDAGNDRCVGQSATASPFPSDVSITQGL